MPRLSLETLTMPAANLGGENPLPMLMPRLSATASGHVDASVPVGDRKFFGYGLDGGWLPHRGQDDYDRHQSARDFVSIVLENEFLRATFLPEVGGRLWSLVHKPSGRDLLFANPVFQPGNLAVRGAWVTGGIEWNACVYGHSPYTCSPLFAAAVEDAQFGSALRLYEWDRTRCVPFQLDFLLPDGSPLLMVRVRLTNPNDATVPMYWWSNMAVSASPDVRVLAPAEKAYTYDYWGPVKAVSVPRHAQFDFTYPTEIPYAADYFFRIAAGARPWIAALDADGRGLIQTSTSRQIGRKLFAWGANSGGARWQDFLSTPGKRYFEIQAGLSRTQLECAPMPADAEWEWLEAYGCLVADPEKVHGDDWSVAIQEVNNRLEQLLDPKLLEDCLNETRSLANRSPDRILHRGSGWGALERIRRIQCLEKPMCSSALLFDDDSLTDDQAPWLSLLHDGVFPRKKVVEEPGAWMIQEEWRALLQDSIESPGGSHWLAQLHLGLMHYAQGNVAAANGAWQVSLWCEPSGWTHRNLAVISRLQDRKVDALFHYSQAIEMLPGARSLLVECCEYFLELGLAEQTLNIIDRAPRELRVHTRIRFLEARAGLALRLPARLEQVMREDYELVDIREGESSLTTFWFDLCRAGLNHIHHASNHTCNGCRPNLTVPPRLDFRVTSGLPLGIIPFKECTGTS